jgi:hypothetical protein
MLCGEGFSLPLSIKPLEGKRSKLSREFVKKSGFRGRAKGLIAPSSWMWGPWCALSWIGPTDRLHEIEAPGSRRPYYLLNRQITVATSGEETRRIG